MPRYGVILAVAATASLAVGPPSARATDPLTCQGQVATVVGAADQAVTGTDGPDVIVSNGAWSLRGRAGDDLVCVTGSVDFVKVLGGGGDDVLDGRGEADRGLRVTWLGGAGRDTVYGTAGVDFVSIQHPEGDVVSTGDGDDEVIVRHHALTARSADFIDLGAGDDDLTTGRRSPVGSVVAGGPGHDHVGWDGPMGRSWTINARRGRLVRGQQVRTYFSGLEAFGVLSYARRTTFIGSDADEELRLWGPSPLVARGGGGDDELVGGDADDILVGGPGRDRVSGRDGEDLCRAERTDTCERP